MASSAQKSPLILQMDSKLTLNITTNEFYPQQTAEFHQSPADSKEDNSVKTNQERLQYLMQHQSGNMKPITPSSYASGTPNMEQALLSEQSKMDEKNTPDKSINKIDKEKLKPFKSRRENVNENSQGRRVHTVEGLKKKQKKMILQEQVEYQTETNLTLQDTESNSDLEIKSIQQNKKKFLIAIQNISQKKAPILSDSGSYQKGEERKNINTHQIPNVIQFEEIQYIKSPQNPNNKEKNNKFYRKQENNKPLKGQNAEIISHKPKEYAEDAKIYSPKQEPYKQKRSQSTDETKRQNVEMVTPSQGISGGEKRRRSPYDSLLKKDYPINKSYDIATRDFLISKQPVTGNYKNTPPKLCQNSKFELDFTEYQKEKRIREKHKFSPYRINEYENLLNSLKPYSSILNSNNSIVSQSPNPVSPRTQLPDLNIPPFNSENVRNKSNQQSRGEHQVKVQSQNKQRNSMQQSHSPIKRECNRHKLFDSTWTTSTINNWNKKNQTPLQTRSKIENSTNNVFKVCHLNNTVSYPFQNNSFKGKPQKQQQQHQFHKKQDQDNEPEVQKPKNAIVKMQILQQHNQKNKHFQQQQDHLKKLQQNSGNSPLVNKKLLNTPPKNNKLKDKPNDNLLEDKFPNLMLIEKKKKQKKTSLSPEQNEKKEKKKLKKKTISDDDDQLKATPPKQTKKRKEKPESAEQILSAKYQESQSSEQRLKSQVFDLEKQSQLLHRSLLNKKFSFSGDYNKEVPHFNQMQTINSQLEDCPKMPAKSISDARQNKLVIDDSHMTTFYRSQQLTQSPVQDSFKERISIIAQEQFKGNQIIREKEQKIVQRPSEIQQNDKKKLKQK